MRLSLRFAVVPVVLFTALLVGCPSKPKGSHPPANSSDCPVVCQHLRDMQCVDKTPGGVPCEDWLCTAHGVKLECLQRSTTCDEATKFQVSGCP